MKRLKKIGLNCYGKVAKFIVASFFHELTEIEKSVENVLYDQWR